MAYTRTGYANYAAFPAIGSANIIYVDLSNGNEYLWLNSAYVAYTGTQAGVRLGYQTAAWFVANPNFLLGKGQKVHLLQTGTYKIGDGVTVLSGLAFLGGSTAYAAGTGLTLVGSTFSIDSSVVTLTGAQALSNKTGNISQWINDIGYITSAALSPYLTTANAALTYQPIGSYITLGSLSASSPLSYNNGTGAFTIQVANTSQGGYLSSTDWNTFNGKQAAGSYALTTNTLSQFAATTSLQLAGVISDETGSGALVFGTSPTFTTDITTPLIIGGSAVGSTIQYKGTSGVGTSTVATHQFLVGNNGGTTAMSVYNSGNINVGNAVTTNQRLVRIGQDTGVIDIGSVPGNTVNIGLWFQPGTPSTANYALSGNATNTYLNAASALYHMVAGNFINTITTTTYLSSPLAASTGAITNFTFTTSANTNQTLSTNIPNFKVTGSVKQKATGADSLQYYNWFTSNTSSYVGASTLTLGANAVFEYMQGGTNSTITTSAAIYVPTLALTNTTTGIGLLITAPTGATTNTAARFLQNNGQVDIGSIATGSSTIWLGQATPSASNYSILMAGSSALTMQASSTVGLSQNQGTHSLILGAGTLTFSDTTLNCIFGTTTGTKIGTATTQKLSFWNATPIVQPSGATQAAPAAYATGAFGLDSNANMQALYDLVVAMRTAMVNSGLMKGAA